MTETKKSMIENIVEYINTQLPLLTDYFNEDKIELSKIEIVNKEVILTSKTKHNFSSEDCLVFLKDVSFPIKIVSIVGNIIKLDFPHHLIAKEIAKVSISGVDDAQYNGTFNVLDDIDGYTLKIDIDVASDYIPVFTNGIVIRNHSEIINGFRKISKITDTTFKIKDFTIELQDSILLLEGAIIDMRQRVNGAFDLRDAIDCYCGTYKISDADDDSQKLITHFKERSNLTCYLCIEPNIINKHREGTSFGVLEYLMNLYIFIPIKQENKYEQREIIEEVTFNVFNRILGEKVLNIGGYLGQTKTSPLCLESCGSATERDNVFYIHNIKFSYTAQLNDSDFRLNKDYFRFNKLGYSVLNQSLKTTY